MTDRQTRWHNRLYRLDTGSASESFVLDEAMIKQWLQGHRAEYNAAT